MTPPAADAVDPRAALVRAWTLASPLLGPAPREAVRILRRPGGGPGKRVRVGRPAGEGEAGHDAAWPTSTDQWCWYCCHPFEGQPLPMPVKYDDRRDEFHVMGTFCSWACMKTYNHQESTSYLKSANANNITMFHKRCTGVLAPIRPAPPKQALRVFGGSMDIREFRAASGKPLAYAVLPPRMIVHQHAIEERDACARRPPPASAAQKAAADLHAAVTFRDVSAKNETLRLKRPKPLQKNRNQLERTMGLGPRVVPAASTPTAAAAAVEPLGAMLA